MSSFLFKGATRTKQSTARRFRSSKAPYIPPTDLSKAQSLLLDNSSFVSGDMLDKRHKEIHDAVSTSSQPAFTTDAGNTPLADSRMSYEPEFDGSYTNTDDDDNDDWTDENGQPLCFLSVRATQRNGPDPLAQSWSERLAQEQHAWDGMLGALCDALLAYTHTGVPSAQGSSAPHPSPPFSILCVGLTTSQKLTFSLVTPTSSNIETLVRHGYIPPTPASPSVAFHINVLQYTVALRRHASVISLQSITAAICEVHNKIYARHMRVQLSKAVDVYLALIRMIDARLATSLGRNNPDWRKANACAACSYHLKGEKKLNFSVLLTCDGNESLKRLAGASVKDTRVFDHSYFLDNAYVDKFANEVRNRQKSKNSRSNKEAGGVPKSTGLLVNGNNDEQSDVEMADSPLDESCAEDHSDSKYNEDERTPCEERWKNARADDQRGKPLVVFDETGIFVVLCRHGTIVLAEDMRKSGELSKYGLAALDTLVRIFGDDILIGYDIGCTFRGTALRSPLVGPLVREHRTRFVTGSFHGYAHERKCQLSNHPLHTEGAGLESFEQNEQLFASTNTAAHPTRHSSPFHRRQHVVLRFMGYDSSRRSNLGSVIKAKYTRALDHIRVSSREILKLCPEKCDDDWRAMFQEERRYYESLKAPSEGSTFAMGYVRQLRNLTEKEKTFNHVFSTNLNFSAPLQIEMTDSQALQSGSRFYQRSAASTRKLEAERVAASEQLAVAQIEVSTTEREHSIFPRWTPGCPEWQAAVKREQLNDYLEALRDLELLVVQRIAELEKAHLVGTGYKLRQKINKSIYRREKATHSALERYNIAARALDPPRPTLTFKELVECAYVADFDFLRYSEHGALDAEWALPIHRQCLASWHKLQRAKEEIERLNIEIRRVYTHMRDEELILSQNYQKLCVTAPDLAHTALMQLQLVLQVNRQILRDLESTSKLKGFSGDLSYGERASDTSNFESQQVVLPEMLPAELSPAEGTSNLALAASDMPALEFEDNEEPGDEPDDEDEHAMTGFQDSCKVM
ncbi:hypothetical protein RhiLY_14388 [Ceratobasidium sp. AG-Ba]|nr:hypothetical protein RhiLY_14388 [Ceratobasidium sp. AG-Ba]